PHPPFRSQPIQGYYWGVFGEARLDLGDKGASLYLDPLTLEHPSVMTLVARWGDELNGSGRELVVEALEARKARGTSGITLSQLAGGARLLSFGGGSMVDAGVVVHGDLVDEDAVRALLKKALKAAWLASVRGWKVGDLLGSTGKGPDAGLFVETLLRELYHALLEQGADLVAEIEAFVEVDPPGPEWPSVRVSLVLSRPLEVLLPLEQWVGRGLRNLLGMASSGTTGAYGNAALGLASCIAEHVLVRTELLWAVEVPQWMGPLGGPELPDEVGLVLRGQTNLASLAALAGRGGAGWESRFEVLLRGLPGAALALVPGMGSPDWKWVEITLLRVALREAATPRVLLSQVLYDALGRDADLEFVEVVNAWDRVVDLEGYVLEDDAGRFEVRGHHPLLPGDHLLVVRNGSASDREWGFVPDADRMGLRLSNEGDLVALSAPDGTQLDLVAWEGHLPGWEGLDAGEGQALRRGEGDLDRCEPSAWTVEMPAPRRSGR
ncbi:MAG: lamin tail domain-containing protein, partial [Thermoplasmata archaeon]|nr:lamin tail domain-containing protein [Thermoplasmata archaeon]